MSKATAFAPPLIAFLLGCTALGNCAQAGWFDAEPKPAAPVAKKDDKPAPAPAATLDDSIREAQMLRLAGNYSEALSHLSQLMLVAADESTVISEYGKTLVSMGRADEAEKFLTRAEELQPNDWTIYSALGVAYDEIGNQKEAQVNYEHALALRPGEPSVLNNYALSRMLAKDPVSARKLAERAETANAAAKDEKIARNIALIRSMAPEASEGVAANTPAPGTIAPPVVVPPPRVAVSSAPLAPVKTAQPVSPTAKPVAAPVASAAMPKPLANGPVAQQKPQTAPSQTPYGVVMQPVPADPLAGPYGSKTAVATHEPRSLQPKAPADSQTPVSVAAKAEAPKPAEPAKPVSPAQKPVAVATVPSKPAALAQAKPVVPTAKVSIPVKAADVKPAAAQPAVVKAADAKPQDAKAKATSKDAIPGLRMSANAY